MAAPYFVPSSVFAADGKPGANDRITIGAIGVGGRASLLLKQLPEAGQIVALCDCNLPRAEKFKARHKGNWPVYQTLSPDSRTQGYRRGDRRHAASSSGCSLASTLAKPAKMSTPKSR